MVVLLTVLHVLFCLFLILVILLQTGKGAGMGTAFGGSSQSVFGPRGAGSFIGKATGVVAALFMITSLVLAWFSSSGGTGIANKAGALAANQAEKVEDVDLSKAVEESALPPDGQSESPASDSQILDGGPSEEAEQPPAAEQTAPASAEEAQTPKQQKPGDGGLPS